MEVKITIKYLAVLIYQIIIMKCDLELGLKDSKHVTYAKLCADVKNRGAVVHKTPPGFMKNEEDHTNITVQLFVIDDIDLDQVHQVMTVVAYFKLSWFHKELTWNPSDYGGHSFLIMDTESVWIPEFAVAIGDKDSFYTHIPPTLKLDSTGVCAFTRHQYISFRCEIDFMKYPFDKQVCRFGLYPTAEPILNLELKEFHFNMTGIYQNTGEWSTINFSQEMVPSGDLEKYPRFTFNVRRRSIYYVIVIIFPMVLTSLLIPLVFFIPARSGEKMSYTVAIFTSSAIFIGLISDVMPRSLTTFPYLAILLTEVMVESIAAILGSLLVINRFEKENKRTEARINCPLGSRGTKRQPSIMDVNIASVPNDVVSGHVTHRCSLTSHQLDRILSVIFGVGPVLFLGVLFGFTGWVDIF